MYVLKKKSLTRQCLPAFRARRTDFSMGGVMEACICPRPLLTGPIVGASCCETASWCHRLEACSLTQLISVRKLFLPGSHRAGESGSEERCEIPASPSTGIHSPAGHFPALLASSSAWSPFTMALQSCHHLHPSHGCGTDPFRHGQVEILQDLLPQLHRNEASLSISRTEEAAERSGWQMKKA